MVFGMKGGGHPFYKIQDKRGLLAVSVGGQFYLPYCDACGIKRAPRPSRQARGDRDFKATTKEWSEERYPATQRTSKERKAQAGARGDRDFKATTKEWSEERYPATQRQQSVTKYIDESGNVVAAYVYGDFGETLERSGPMADVFPHRFSTKYHDGETGLCYYGYRFYNPALKRWMNRDPIGEEGGVNLYGFCGNQSLLSFDTLGMTAVTISMYTELRPDLKSNLKKLFLMISATITEPPPLGNMINFIQLKTTDGVNWSLDACKDAEPYYIETYDLINRTSENENKQKIVTMGDAPCGAISDIVDFFVAVVEIQRSCKPSQIKFLVLQSFLWK